MNVIRDLNIEKEILPLFDSSLNLFTKKKIIQILETPLKSETEIINRHHIFKGFTLNRKILKGYSYSILYLNEIHFFLIDEKIETFSSQQIKYKFLISKESKRYYANKVSQLILLLHRIESRYFSRLDLNVFPDAYQKDLKLILSFLSEFDLNKHEEIIRENKLKNYHVLPLLEKINKLKANKSVGLFFDRLFAFEAYLSINYGILKHQLIFPSFTKNKLTLTEFYHPLVTHPIKNNIETTSNVIVLNGPNMSGKSTLLKAIGLCVYFAHVGIGIPASAAKIPFYHHFSIKINKSDDVLNGYSHFMKEILDLKNLVINASNHTPCFAVFDELFSTTNVEDAFEICKKTINGLSKFKNSLFFISTHIQKLQKVSNDNISNYYLDCELIENKPKFNYKLKSGWSEIKIGQILFDSEGLNNLL